MTVKYHKRQMIQALRCAADACSYPSGTGPWTLWGSALGITSRHFNMPAGLMVSAVKQVGIEVIWEIPDADTKRERLLEAARRIEEGGWES